MPFIDWFRLIGARENASDICTPPTEGPDSLNEQPASSSSQVDSSEARSLRREMVRLQLEQRVMNSPLGPQRSKLIKIALCRLDATRRFRSRTSLRS